MKLDREMKERSQWVSAVIQIIKIWNVKMEGHGGVGPRDDAVGVGAAHDLGSRNGAWPTSHSRSTHYNTAMFFDLTTFLVGMSLAPPIT